ncbi:PepSY-associated TM helix domain-containing protein [Pseudocolwellia agarivorans]|uniref:PepSY-associated TM helix domain-containing protein n=1 Tax=Pseudocolwellia agarivorans TaxID=1911682 RepID=UPI003F884A2A
MNQKNWFLLHHWAGFHLSLLLTFVLLTGTFATISTDLDWLTNSAVRADKRVSQEQTIDWSALLNTVNRNIPQATLLSIHRPEIPWHNIEVIARNKNGERFRVYLDAYTHQITGEGKWLNWQRLFRQVHRHLMLPNQLGITIVGFLGLMMLFLLITSLYIYRHWWRSFFVFNRIKWPKVSPQERPKKIAGKQRKFWSELHKIIGLWSLWFVMVISVTGVWYLIERWGAGARYVEIENPAIISQKDISLPPSDYALSNALNYINKHHSEYKINQIRFIAEKQIIEISGQEHALLVRNRANNKLFDALSGIYIGGRQGEELGLHFRISEAADLLHFGTFSSWIFRYVWFVFGVLLTSLSITGVYMYLLRLKQIGVYQNSKTRSALYTLWHKTYWIKWPSILVLILCVILTLLDFVINN